MNELKFNDIEIKIPEQMAGDIILQAENVAKNIEEEPNECIVITVNSCDVW